jgi:hypothetical protein
VLDSPKPVREVEIPAGETHAYSLEEEVRMLAILPEPAATVVAMATFTGARKGEIRGFQVYYPMRRRAPMDEIRVFLGKVVAALPRIETPAGLSYSLRWQRMGRLNDVAAYTRTKRFAHSCQAH